MDRHAMSLERAVTVLVETVETAETHHGVPASISLCGTVSGRVVLDALRVVLNEMRGRADVCVDALKSKILVDHMFFSALLERQDFKPTVEKKVSDHLAWTRRNFETCFAGDLETAMKKLREVLGEKS